jgi:co-chaperonin GroES (HSP10)
MMTDQVQTAATDAEVEARLPKPVGYRLLVALPQIEETIGDTGILKARQTMREERTMSTVGLVLDMGEQAYTDKTRFPNGPWCKVGDYVVFAAYTGTRVNVDSVEYRLMNDDSIEAVVTDPRGVTRA